MEEQGNMMSDQEQEEELDELTGAEEQEQEQEEEVHDIKGVVTMSQMSESESQQLTQIHQVQMIHSEEPSGVPVYKYDGIHSYMDVFVMLQQIRPNHENITRVPPQKPLAHGQVYVYALTDGQSPYDWRFDGFQWANLRANSFPKKSANQVISRHEFRLVDNGNKVDFFRHEYHEAGQNFRTPINIQSWKYPYIIIHYFGNYPVNEAVIAPHANRRTSSLAESHLRQKRRKKPMSPNNSMARAIDSAVASIAADGITTIHLDEDGYAHSGTESLAKRARISTNDPNYVYETVEIEGMETTGTNKTLDMSQQLAVLSVNGIEVSGPNYRRRVAVNQKKAKPSVFTPNAFLTKEDIYGCYLFKESFGDNHRVIRRLDFSHGTNIIIAEEHLIAHANTLLGAHVVREKITFTYQATAKLYRFLVSTLFIKHPIFENEPCIPLATLLHRQHNEETHGRFFRTMKEIIPALDSDEINLIVCNENGVTKAIENELPGIPTVHVSDPEGPRTSSPKLDFVLVSIAKGINFDHTKMIHLMYFLQCYYFNNIIRSLLGSCEGDLLIDPKYDPETCAHPSLAERILPEGVVEELEDSLLIPELIQMLSRNPPTVLGSGSDYEQCSKNELQLFEGLAHFFISKDRVDWIKAKSLFQVKGLGGKVYNVKLSGRTCTCLRGKACEHVLAVLIATGLLARQT